MCIFLALDPALDLNLRPFHMSKLKSSVTEEEMDQASPSTK